MNYLQRLHALFVSTLGMIVVWVGILGWAEVARGQASYEELHAFAPVGYSPYAGLVQDSAGNLYGTTPYGGASGYGTVYKLAPSGAFTVLHSFNGSDGSNPYAGLVQDSAGNLYGTTPYGGAFGYGTVYKLEPSGDFTVLHSFGHYVSDGAEPFAGLVQDSAGNLYGTTPYGGGF